MVLAIAALGGSLAFARHEADFPLAAEYIGVAPQQVKFRSGNVQAVRIPAELADDRSDQELEALAICSIPTSGLI